MDPFTRHILERTFEALIDAGINPIEIRGSNAAVFSGTTMSEFDLIWQIDNKGGYGIMGKNRCLNANRVSYWLDLNGTSSVVLYLLLRIFRDFETRFSEDKREL